MPETLIKKMKNGIITIFIYTVPLNIRKRLAIWLGKQNWISQGRRYWLPQELLRDMKSRNINTYHKFLWNNHLAYAETYNSDSRFGYDNIKESRKILFKDLSKIFLEIGINREKDINSVLEVGCSLGYLLRYMEEHFFPSAKVLIGIDIDHQAIAEGTRHIEENRSIVELKQCDMETLHKEFSGTYFDTIFCLGVLMYLQENNAREMVRYMLNHTTKLLVLSGLANPESDNMNLEKSTIRPSDETFIHNFDEMVKSAGGEIVYRRWEGDKMVDNNTIYFIFARPKQA